MNLVETPGQTMNYPFNFTILSALEASELPEARGLMRDEVRHRLLLLAPHITNSFRDVQL